MCVGLLNSASSMALEVAGAPVRKAVESRGSAATSVVAFEAELLNVWNLITHWSICLQVVLAITSSQARWRSWSMPYMDLVSNTKTKGTNMYGRRTCLAPRMLSSPLLTPREANKPSGRIAVVLLNIVVKVPNQQIISLPMSILHFEKPQTCYTSYCCRLRRQTKSRRTWSPHHPTLHRTVREGTHRTILLAIRSLTDRLALQVLRNVFQDQKMPDEEQIAVK